MNKKQEQMAKDAQKANKKDWTIDDLFEAILESTRKTGFGMVHALNGFIKMQSYDIDQIISEYAKQIGKETLTREEKQMALLNHVLEQGKQDEQE